MDPSDPDPLESTKEAAPTHELEETHLHIEPICSLCFQDILIVSGEWAIALLNDHKSPFGTRPRYCSKKFQFPKKRGSRGDQDRYPLCSIHKCTKCAESPESVTMHADCHRLFLQSYHGRPALEHVWVATAWRLPWEHRPTQPKLHLDVVDPTLASVTIPIAKALGMPQLASLPPEVLQLVKSYSHAHFLWNYQSIKARAVHTSAFDESSSDDNGKTYNIGKITSWHRGKEAQIGEGALTSDMFRLTVDYFGLLEIERFSKLPTYVNNRPSTTRAYFFVSSREIADTVVYFRFGHARIEPATRRRHDCAFLDIPTLPFICMPLLMRPNPLAACHLHTIDLRSITGMTFLYRKRTLMAVHAHTIRAPTAASTAQSLFRLDHDQLIWVYIPIPDGDRILKFGIRSNNTRPKTPAYHSTALLITTELAGDLVVGPCLENSDADIVYSRVPTVFVYDIPARGGTTIIGVTGEETWGTLSNSEFPLFTTSPTYETLKVLGNLFMNDISLKGATCINVFNDRRSGLFKGILLEYEDGSQTTAGQCKVGIDPVEKYSRPAFLGHRKAFAKRTFSHGIPHHEIECHFGMDGKSHYPGYDGCVVVSWNIKRLTSTYTLQTLERKSRMICIGRSQYDTIETLRPKSRKGIDLSVGGL